MDWDEESSVVPRERILSAEVMFKIAVFPRVREPSSNITLPDFNETNAASTLPIVTTWLASPVAVDNKTAEASAPFHASVPLPAPASVGLHVLDNHIVFSDMFLY